MRKVIFMMLVLIFCQLKAEIITLYECHEKARQNHPLKKQTEIRHEIFELNRKNLNRGYLPGFKLNANAVYMSDVVEFDQVMSELSIPGMKTLDLGQMPNDQYKATLDINQVVYDGGMIRYSKELEQAALEADKSSIQVEIYNVYEQINQVYFSLLMLEKQNELTRLFENQIKEQKHVLKSTVEAGAALPVNIDVLDAELLKVQQQLHDFKSGHHQLIKTLETLVGESLVEVELKLPKVRIDASEIHRPELTLFKTKREKLAASQKLAGRTLIPRLSVFGTLGYGNPPGNNFFRNEYDTYYTVGMGISWTPFDWHKTKRQQQMMRAQQRILNTRERDFRRSVDIILDRIQADIEKIENKLDTDRDLIEIRERISKVAASKLSNGTMTSTEYLAELNKERKARLNLEMHIIQLEQAKIHYLTLSGQIKDEY